MVRGSAPSWAKESRDRGVVAGDQPATVTVYLPLRAAAAASSLLDQVSDPTSSSYGQYLTPDQFRQRFAASDADVAAVASFLRGAGFTVSNGPTYNNHVTATGTIARADAAFATTVHRYAYRGHLLNAPNGQLRVPSSLNGKVLAVTGLDQTLARPQSDTTAPPPAAPDASVTAAPRHPGSAGDAPPPPVFANAPPCSTYFREKIATQYPSVNGSKVPFAPCGYTPAQYQGAYGTAGLTNHGLDGSGVTVAITDAYAAPTILQDANTYAVRHGQSPFGRKQFSQIFPHEPYRYGYDDQTNGDLCGEQGWYGEETLDVEAVHAMAPGANVLFVAGRSCDDPDLLAALNKIVSKRRADIITNSWGDIGEDVDADILQAYNETFLQAALEGIGVFYSSGDDGDDSLDTTDGSAVTDFPSTEPIVTAVGGTSLGVNRNNGYGFETTSNARSRTLPPTSSARSASAPKAGWNATDGTAPPARSRPTGSTTTSPTPTSRSAPSRAPAAAATSTTVRLRGSLTPGSRLGSLPLTRSTTRVTTGISHQARIEASGSSVCRLNVHPGAGARRAACRSRSRQRSRSLWGSNGAKTANNSSTNAA